jgi:lysozyme
MSSTGSGSGEEMKMSETGLGLLKQWEALRLQKYKDAGGKWTIGYGHLLTREELMGGKFDGGITKQEALTLLASDLRPFEECVKRNVRVALQQHEFDTLVSFAFNVGAQNFGQSTLLKKLNRLDYVSVPDELRKWVRVNGKRCQGLANRREKEILLWKGCFRQG